MWQRVDAPNNWYRFDGLGLVLPYVDREDIGTFEAKLSKMTATGGEFCISHDVDYAKTNLFNNVLTGYPADWNVKLTAEMRQPLLQGAGIEFNRIAGPGAKPGQYNGVVLARINTDIALADFEIGVRNLVNDVETTYWELYFAYRNFDAVIAGRESALSTWRQGCQPRPHRRQGRRGRARGAGARAVLRFPQRRRTIAQPPVHHGGQTPLSAGSSGHRRPAHPSPGRAHHRQGGLRLERRAQRGPGAQRRAPRAKVDRQAPRIGVGGRQELPPAPARLPGPVSVAGHGQPTGRRQYARRQYLHAAYAPPDTNAYRTLTSGQFQQWQMGFQLNMPLGFRREMAGVRNAELQLTKERAKLQEGELELSHQLAFAIRDLEANYVLSETNFNRRIAAQHEVEAVSRAYENDTVTIDRVLEAHRSLAAGRKRLLPFAWSITAGRLPRSTSAKARLLEYNGVYLAEGPWPAKACFDARRRARARDAALHFDYGFTKPEEISRGPMDQQMDSEGVSPAAPANAAPSPAPVPAMASRCPRRATCPFNLVRCPRRRHRPLHRRPSRKRRIPTATMVSGTLLRDCRPCRATQWLTRRSAAPVGLTRFGMTTRRLSRIWTPWVGDWLARLSTRDQGWQCNCHPNSRQCNSQPNSRRCNCQPSNRVLTRFPSRIPCVKSPASRSATGGDYASNDEKTLPLVPGLRPARTGAGRHGHHRPKRAA